MNKFIISESEKQRILEMHQNATSRQYLMEIHSSETINVTMELGKSANPQDIIEMYNELVEEGTALVDYSEEGMFYNEDDQEIPTDVILDELNYAIVGQSNIGRLPYKYLLNNWSSFESKLYNLFKYSTNTSLSLVLKANGLGNNMLEFSNAATGVVYEILQGFQWDGKPTQN
jgi:hypothetical protein